MSSGSRDARREQRIIGAARSDLTTGSVVGLSFAGIWRGERGKFAYALNLPEEVRAMIDQRLRGEPITPPPPPPDTAKNTH